MSLLQDILNGKSVLGDNDNSEAKNDIGNRKRGRALNEIVEDERPAKKANMTVDIDGDLSKLVRETANKAASENQVNVDPEAVRALEVALNDLLARLLTRAYEHAQQENRNEIEAKDIDAVKKSFLPKTPLNKGSGRGRGRPKGSLNKTKKIVEKPRSSRGRGRPKGSTTKKNQDPSQSQDLSLLDPASSVEVVAAAAAAASGKPDLGLDVHDDGHDMNDGTEKRGRGRNNKIKPELPPL